MFSPRTARVLSVTDVPHSEATRERASSAGIMMAASDVELVNSCDVVLSIVPPGEALAVARRIAYAYNYSSRGDRTPQLYVDLNATSAQTAESIAAALETSMTMSAPGPRFLDGAIFGGPPSKLLRGHGWRKPRIAVSGPISLDPEICKVLNIRSVGNLIGQASTLKMCFASLTKGLTALALQSFTTATQANMLSELKEELRAFAPPLGADMMGFLEKNIAQVPPKAYRWIKEMEEIGDTHEESGFTEDVFKGIADVYRTVSEETELGTQKMVAEQLDDVVKDLAGSLKGKRKRRCEGAGDGGEKRARTAPSDIPIF
jgi:3-hydroxyisobutyrate dehydrogenase-like beta-hydroxyacid dehydrogenase